jgi:integrase
MATYTKRGDRWRVQVTIDGARKSKTLPTKAHAQAWVKMIEVDHANSAVGHLPPRKLCDLFERYGREVSVNKGRDGRRPEYNRIKRFMRDPIADVFNHKIAPQDIADWRDRLLTRMSGTSVNRDWNLMSAVFTRAVREWGWMNDNPMFKVKRPPSNKPRSRRPTNDEIQQLKDVMQYAEPPQLVCQRVAVLMMFAIETAMRTGEMCRTEWKNVSEKSIFIPDKIAKNGHSRVVPLSQEARRLIDVMDKSSSTVFNLKVDQVDANFRKYRTKAKIDDLHFHDFRREALTRLAKKVDVMTLAKISGHRDVKILLNTYYAPKMDDIADMLD